MIKTNPFFDFTDFQVRAGLVEAHGVVVAVVARIAALVHVDVAVSTLEHPTLRRVRTNVCVLASAVCVARSADTGVCVGRHRHLS